MQAIVPLFVVSILFLTNPINGFCENFTDEIAYKLRHTPVLKSSISSRTTYNLEKGWNSLYSPKEGIDIVRTFQDHPEVTLVAFFDENLQQWALFFPKNNAVQGIKNYLFLESLEGNKLFFAKSTKKKNINIISKKINGICKKYLIDKHFLSIEDSGLDKNISFSKDKTIGVSPRYSSNFHRGYYKDTRIVLIYPKLKHKEGKLRSYGPVEPYIAIKYAKEYESKEFFVFDYMNESCYKGVFPSFKILPVPMLQELH
jgi:hypothetical protein